MVATGNRSYPLLGAVKPHVRAAALEIGNQFGVETIYGVAARSGVSEHPLGLALDFMVYNDAAKGDAIAAFVKQNWKRLGVKYIIWQQRIDEGSGWVPMEDRGSKTANHFDHDHVSFEADPSGAGEYSGDTGGPRYATGDGGGGGDFQPLNASVGVRFLEFIAGLVVIAFVVWRALNG